MMYGIFCKAEYFNTLPLTLKEELAGFATVEVVAPVKLKTIPDETNSISSPSGKFSIPINSLDAAAEDEVRVYVVSDGGYLAILGHFNEDKTLLSVLITSWQRIDKQIYREMYDRTTKFLNKLNIED